VAWDGQEAGRRVVEEARRGSGLGCRVGKIEMVVNGRGVPGGPSVVEGASGRAAAWIPGGVVRV